MEYTCARIIILLFTKNARLSHTLPIDFPRIYFVDTKGFLQLNIFIRLMHCDTKISNGLHKLYKKIKGCLS